MYKVLYLQTSPRGKRSYSIAAADAFIDAYKALHPEDEIVTVNLFEKELPPFDGLTLQGKYAILHGKKHSQEELAAWRAVEQVIEEFKSFDKYVLAVPMWNFLIPYKLKHYLDVLIQPTYTFRVTPEGGSEGLVTGKPVFLACARGGAYPPGSEAEALDFQTHYLKMILGFIGLTDVRTLVVEPTLAGGPDEAERRKQEALDKAREIARDF
ncbi:FMN-dependent NADH-azoreductase [Desulfoglaeba alkanexedens]|uniref:FMN dependent NADH:quinone oxidoreductase n=1 Tax=Desulfoglaeba alkanexedens ALDC TaxID=980445 RepID=A0A4P8L4K0_9BACT|nr:NAD(P)H-dependent oxidoreductase [Desulfoglaeba alkanexedens]QCQ21702.1 FMN-dependent NADH-azoreductase [Desulfoglaeba alkanexedens ALDC]